MDHLALPFRLCNHRSRIVPDRPDHRRKNRIERLIALFEARNIRTTDPDEVWKPCKFSQRERYESRRHGAPRKTEIIMAGALALPGNPKGAGGIAQQFAVRRVVEIFVPDGHFENRDAFRKML